MRNRSYPVSAGSVARTVPAQSPALVRGEKPGPYEIVSHVGTGGMDEVYLARDLRLGREVAIKVARERFNLKLTAIRLSRKPEASSSNRSPTPWPTYDEAAL